MNTDRTCCFIGHRDVAATLELSKKLYVIIEMLITEKHIDTFIFGSKSSFDELCRKTVTEIKKNILTYGEFMRERNTLSLTTATKRIFYNSTTTHTSPRTCCLRAERPMLNETSTL